MNGRYSMWVSAICNDMSREYHCEKLNGYIACSIETYYNN